MKRWTNGLPGATKRLGAIMALRAALTFVDLGSPSCTARPGHTSRIDFRFRGKSGRAADITSTTGLDPGCVKTHWII
jgi:hypothetical protein